MIPEFRKSINSILYDRMTSPFYGALIISWIIWNWKAIYLTLFVSEEMIKETKIDYIVANYSSLENLITYPVISTLAILLVLPFIANGAYWTSLKFKNWRQIQKNNIEKKQLLTLEQSIAIRKELKQKEFEYEEILQKRENQIESLNQVISQLENSKNENLSTYTSDNRPDNGKDSTLIAYENLKANSKAIDFFEQSQKSIEKNYHFPSNVPDWVKEYYVVNGIFDRKRYNDGGFYYTTTENGKELYKMYFNEKYI